MVGRASSFHSGISRLYPSLTSDLPEEHRPRSSMPTHPGLRASVSFLGCLSEDCCCSVRLNTTPRQPVWLGALRHPNRREAAF